MPGWRRWNVLQHRASTLAVDAPTTDSRAEAAFTACDPSYEDLVAPSKAAIEHEQGNEAAQSKLGEQDIGSCWDAAMLAMRRLPLFVGQCDRQREEPKFEAEANEVWRWCVCNDAPVFYVGSPAKVWRVLQRVFWLDAERGGIERPKAMMQDVYGPVAERSRSQRGRREDVRCGSEDRVK